MTDSPVPISQAVRRAQAFANSITSNPYCYLFVSDPSAGDGTVPDLVPGSFDSTDTVPRNTMIEGRLVNSAAVAIRNLPYVPGLVYDTYDDQVDLSTATWYAVVNADSYSHVWECLENAGGANSSVQPVFAQVTDPGSAVTTSDGYRWRYSYSVDSATVAALSTSDHFPLVPNSTVVEASIPGSIETILVQDGGKLYNNHMTGTFQSSDVRYGSNTLLYQVTNSNASSVPGFYTGCVMTISSGTGIGQFKVVTDYSVNALGNFVEVESAFDTPPTNGSGWELNPSVLVTGSGSETTNVVAQALVNSSSSNSIYTVEVLDPGENYSWAEAVVVANAVVGVSIEANLRAIIPPPGGLGYDPARELGATAVTVSATLANTEGDLLPANGTFRVLGLIREPTFSNVALTITDPTGTLQTDESLTFFNPVKVAQNVSSTGTDAVLTGDTHSILTLITNTAMVWVSNSTTGFLGEVSAVTNASSITLTSNTPYATSGMDLYLANPKDTVASVSIPVSSSNCYLGTISSPYANSGDYVYGSVSGVSGIVDSVTRSDVVKDFETFVQLNKYRVTVLAGSFVPGEVVAQGNTTATVHSYSNSFLYVSNQVGIVSTGVNVVGETSGAIGTVTTTYSPELVPWTGTIEYAEYVEPVERSPETTEQFVFAFRFS
jgi:hypothetical protein